MIYLAKVRKYFLIDLYIYAVFFILLVFPRFLLNANIFCNLDISQEIAIFYYLTNESGKKPSYYAIITLGVLCDILSGQNIGITPISLLITVNLALYQRGVFSRANFYMIWLGFAIIAIFYSLMQYLLNSCTIKILLRPDLHKLVLSILGYPLIHLFCHEIKKVISR
jgi:hypothetical protein